MRVSHEESGAVQGELENGTRKREIGAKKRRTEERAMVEEGESRVALTGKGDLSVGEPAIESTREDERERERGGERGKEEGEEERRGRKRVHGVKAAGGGNRAELICGHCVCGMRGLSDFATS